VGHFRPIPGTQEAIAGGVIRHAMYLMPEANGLTEAQMRSIQDSTARRDIVARVEGVSIDSERQWGQMDVSQMLAHAADQLRIALGDINVDRARGPLQFAPMRYLMIYVLPWPKGKAKAPHEALTTAPTDVEEDRATLLSLIDRFATTPPSDEPPLHPLFGRMTARDWDVFSYRHLDHHLRQFSA